MQDLPADILSLIMMRPRSQEQLITMFKHVTKEQVIEALKTLSDQNKISLVMSDQGVVFQFAT